MAKKKRRLKNWLQSYLKYVDNSESPIMFHKWTALSTLGAALQRKCCLRWGTLEYFPNLYVLLVAPSGKARKGSAMAVGMNMLQEVENVHLAANSTTRAALVKALADSEQEFLDKETGEPLKHCSMTVMAEEFTVFLGNNDLQMMSDLTSWHNCERRWRDETKHSGKNFINGVWVNILGATTPALIKTALPVDAIGLGLTSRIIFVYESRKEKICPTPFLSKEEIKIGKDLLHDLQIIAEMSGDFTVSEDFIQKWVYWYPHQSKNPPFSDNKFSWYLERRHTYAMKLSMLYNVSRTSTMKITAADLEQAIAHLEETEKKMRLAFSGGSEPSYAQLVSKTMRIIAERKAIKLSDLLQENIDVTYSLMKSILLSLDKAKYISIESEKDEQDPVLRYIRENH
jgi:hypothetical protein